MATDSIRLATQEDVPAITGMIERFYEKSGVPHKLNMDSAFKSIGAISGLGSMFFCKYGMIGYIPGVIWYSGDRVAQVAMIWTDKAGYGVKLLRHAQTHAKENGYKYFQCNSLNSLESGKMNTVLERLDYEQIEQAYMRAL